MSVIREGLCVWFWPLLFLRSSHSSSMTCLTTPWLTNRYNRASGSTGDSSTCLPAASQPLSAPYPFLLLLSSQQDTPLSGQPTIQCQVSEGSGWKRDKTTQWRQRNQERKKMKGGIREREEWKRMLGLVDKLHSQRALILPTDVNNGEDEGGVCVCAIKVKRNREWGGVKKRIITL